MHELQAALGGRSERVDHRVAPDDGPGASRDRSGRRRAVRALIGVTNMGGVNRRRWAIRHEDGPAARARSANAILAEPAWM
jgi:hypothetical protein